MKKTFPANINGTIFYIDEDAYTLLSNYLDQLRKTFPGDEGKEITDDIEARISELFNERIKNGATVIVYADVNSVIETMGRPSDLAADKDDSQTSPPPFGTTPPPYQGSAASATAAAPTVKRLYRDERNKVFGGVVSGLGLYLGWNITVMRILLVLLAVFTYFWPFVIVYLIAWMVIPAARTPRQILEMTGQPVNISTVGNTILGTADPSAIYATGQNSVTLSDILRTVGKCIIGFFGLIALFTGIAFVIAFIVALCGLVSYLGWQDALLLDGLNFTHLPLLKSAYPIVGAFGIICMILAVLIPCIGIVWGACCALFNARGVNRTTMITAIILEVVLIIGTILMLRIADIQAVQHVAGITLMGSSSALTSCCIG